MIRRSTEEIQRIIESYLALERLGFVGEEIDVRTLHPDGSGCGGCGHGDPFLNVSKP